MKPFKSVDMIRGYTRAIVLTGSYNWTVAAEQQNGENFVVIRDPRLAGAYTEN